MGFAGFGQKEESPAEKARREAELLRKQQRAEGASTSGDAVAVKPRERSSAVDPDGNGAADGDSDEEDEDEDEEDADDPVCRWWLSGPQPRLHGDLPGLSLVSIVQAGSEESTLGMPISHELNLQHGEKAVSAIALDPSGARG